MTSREHVEQSINAAKASEASDSAGSTPPSLKHRLLLKTPKSSNKRKSPPVENNNKEGDAAPRQDQIRNADHTADSREEGSSGARPSTAIAQKPSLTLFRAKENSKSKTIATGGDESCRQDTQNGDLGTRPRKQKKTTILLRSKIQSQPRPSPPFPGLVRVVSGRYLGLSGFLSPTGTYGFSVLSTDDGRRVTVNDNDVVDAAAQNSDSNNNSNNNNKQGKRELEEESKAEIRDIFLDSLKKYVRDEDIEEQKAEVEGLRFQNNGGTVVGGEEMLQLRKELLENQEERLDRLYEEHHYFRLASRAFGRSSSTASNQPPIAN
eukprot:CAMPEP_0168776618 /NCGR_PEP_ID=MMETSP0725-20121227/6130_1 /TAXON_ID=265536 /ORGANISM="Amphiprora sp., Strain CCMP467" /LENGTH=320 /DNA_ID=CAMNT_0008826303 /DNA_START=17 /DNA_END=979 /DNA_ORIENTATION=+